MDLEAEIEAIKKGIKSGKFSNEASVSQGIVSRLLHALDWPAYDPDAVWPEYSLGNRRVDFALCCPPKKPIAFIEVKQIGQSDGAERQLFEYAFHAGVPLAILTDGQKWNFFLPGEQGDYGERRVCMIDLLNHNLNECSARLLRYLLHSDMASGAAILAARDDYRDVAKNREMHTNLPKACKLLIAEEDEMLLEIVADRVERLCGCRPDAETVSQYLKNNITINPAQNEPAKTSALPHALTPELSKTAQLIKKQMNISDRPSALTPTQPIPAHAGQIGFHFEGQFHAAQNARDTLRKIFELLIRRDPTFAERFNSLPKHGRTRRYLAKNAADLYPNRPDLSSESIQLDSGWWMSTNHSKQSIRQIITLACEVAGVRFQHDLKVSLGD